MTILTFNGYSILERRNFTIKENNENTTSFIIYGHRRAPNPKSVIFVMILCYVIGIFYDFFMIFVENL